MRNSNNKVGRAIKSVTSTWGSNSYGNSQYIVKSPKGREYTVENISAFARKHKLDRSSLSRLVNGIRDTHKNWTLVS